MSTSNNHNKIAPSELRRLLAEFTRLFRSLSDPYRPELHYMRGPGPKWRAKYAAAPAEAPQLPGLAHSKS